MEIEEEEKQKKKIDKRTDLRNLTLIAIIYFLVIIGFVIYIFWM